MRALVVDDDPSIRTMIQLLLELEGFEVATGEDGRGALAQARRMRPDVVVLDVMMPGIGGFEAAAQLRADPELQAVPIVFCSAAATSDRAWRGSDLGAAAYVTKPFEVEELVAEVRRAVGRPATVA